MFATRCIKGQVQTFIKLQDKGQFNTLILPNLKLNRFKYHVLNHGTSSTFQIETFKYFHFTEYKTKYFRDKVIPIHPFYRIQNQTGSHIMFRNKGQVQTSHLSNL